MSRRMYIRLIASTIMVLALGVFGLGFSHARSNSPEPSPIKSVSVEREAEQSSRANEIREAAEARREEVAAQARTKVADKKDQARIQRCEKIQDKLKNRYAQTSQRAQQMQERIAAHLTRAESFVTKRNLTVPNSASLLADIEAKRLAAAAAAEEIRTVATGFNCSNDDAQAQAALIKAQVETFKTVVKDYRKSVQTYFTAVIAAYASSKPSSSASPSLSPSPSTGGEL